jgi:hypothetical protein
MLAQIAQDITVLFEPCRGGDGEVDGVGDRVVEVHNPAGERTCFFCGQA